MTRRVLELRDPTARDPAVTGAKAAGLALASAAGLPVLPGVVVPVAESAPVVRAASDALNGEGSEVRGRLAAMKVQPDPQLVDELRGRLADFQGPLIVRSSSPLEDDGTWSGAFSSFHGIAVDDLATAIRGCWGSAFSVGVLARAQQTGTPPDQLGLAVLVQPELAPDLGGTARLADDGAITVTSTEGSLLPLMEGYVDGSVSRVSADGSVQTAPDVDESVVVQVSGLVRQVNAVLGHHLIEWAAVDREVHLLQSLRSGQVVSGRQVDERPIPSLRSPTAVRIARLVQRFPGPLGHELVLPWAVALDCAAPAPAPSRLDPMSALVAAEADASALTAQLWGGSPRRAALEAQRVMRALRSNEVQEALSIIDRLPRADGGRAAAILGHLDVVRAGLVGAGAVEHDAAFWRMTPQAVRAALVDGRATRPSRFGADQWEPFVHTVVTASGTSHQGTAVVSGAGAGPAYVMADGVNGSSAQGRCVIVAAQPLPSLAPMLWNAAGLVVRARSTAAHLLEFAHSIGVPTVVGCDLAHQDTLAQQPALLAVDGDRGTVSVLPLDA